MSTSIDQVFVKEYESDVFIAFQRQGAKMLSGCRMKDRLKGESVYFPKVGKGKAGKKSRHGLVPVMNQPHSRVECPTDDFYAGDWVDKLDELKTNVDERMLVASGGAWALGREIDDQIIAAACASLPAGPERQMHSNALRLERRPSSAVCWCSRMVAKSTAGDRSRSATRTRNGGGDEATQL